MTLRTSCDTAWRSWVYGVNESESSDKNLGHERVSRGSEELEGLALFVLFLGEKANYE